jgi:hypothetical protein
MQPLTVKKLPALSMPPPLEVAEFTETVLPVIVVSPPTQIPPPYVAELPDSVQPLTVSEYGGRGLETACGRLAARILF